MFDFGRDGNARFRRLFPCNILQCCRHPEFEAQGRNERGGHHVSSCFSNRKRALPRGMIELRPYLRPQRKVSTHASGRAERLTVESGRRADVCDRVPNSCGTMVFSDQLECTYVPVNGKNDNTAIASKGVRRPSPRVMQFLSFSYYSLTQLNFVFGVCNRTPFFFSKVFNRTKEREAFAQYYLRASACPILPPG